MRKVKRAVRSAGFRRLFPVLIVGCILAAVLLASCFRSGSRSIRKVIARELDPLKKMDTNTVSKYVPGDILFPEGGGVEASSDEIGSVFTMFFKDFDYKVRSVKVSGDKANALVTVKTPDSRSLAADYTSALLETLIMDQADDPSVSSADISLEERFLILNRLLSQNTYETVSNDCTISLNRVDGQWVIDQNSALKNSLVGGLISYLSDSELISPGETLRIYLEALSKMDIEQMSTFLGLENLLHSEDAGKSTIAQSLLEQIHENYDFTVGEESIDSYKAAVPASIVTLDGDAVLNAYQEAMTEYMNSPDALIDGAEMREQKSQELLLEQIQNDPPLSESETTFYLTNDGSSWKLENPGNSLSDALFGKLAQEPARQTSDETDP